MEARIVFQDGTFDQGIIDSSGAPIVPRIGETIKARDKYYRVFDIIWNFDEMLVEYIVV